MKCIARYEVRGVLGRGGFGEVFLAFDPATKREVAIKLIRDDLLSEDTVRDWFHREARAIARLNHRGIVTILDYSGPEAAQPYLVMERLHGHTLADVFAKRGLFDPVALCDVGAQIGEALAHAHAHGLVHRDIKPENIFAEPDGRVVITDFGLARAMPGFELGHSLASRGTQVVGTVHFLAPEVILDPANASAMSDVYATGITLFQLAAGRVPFEPAGPHETLRQILSGRHATLLALRPGFAAGVAAIVERCIAKDLTQRTADGTALATALRKAALALGTDRSFAELVRGDDELTSFARALPLSRDDETRIARVSTPRPISDTRLITKPLPPRARRRLRPVALALIGVGLALGGWWANHNDDAQKMVTVAAEPTPTSAPPATANIATPAPSLQPATQAPPPVQPPVMPPATSARAKHPPESRASDEQAPGMLDVNTGQVWSDIFVDGDKQGDTPLHSRISLTAGRHRVRVVNPGFGEVERKVAIRAGKTTTLDIDLEATKR